MRPRLHNFQFKQTSRTPSASASTSRQALATATGRLPFSAALVTYTFTGAPSLSLSANPFTVVALTFTPIGGFAEMANLKNIMPITLLSMVDQLGSMLGNLAGTSVMSTPIPFTQGETVGSVMHFAESFAARISDVLHDPQGQPIFDSQQTLATQRLVVSLRSNISDPFSPSLLAGQGQDQLRFTTAGITDSSANPPVDTDGTNDGTLHRNFNWTKTTGEIGPT